MARQGNPGAEVSECTFDCVTTAPRPESASPAGPPPGLTVGGYRLLTRIGEGGMGAVFRGHHVGTGHAVAIKVLHPDQASDA